MSTETASAPSPRQLALQRIGASRIQLRQQLLQLPRSEDAAGASAPLRLPRQLRLLWRGLRRQLRGSPLAGLALLAVQNWWQHHPWRSTGELVVRELNTSLLPVVRRHPLAAAAVAGGLGLMLVKTRPWRWALVRRQARPLPGRVLNWVFRQLSQAPAQALLSSLMMLLAGRMAPPAAPPAEATNAATTDPTRR